jgi:hypothetical protein
MRWLALLGMVMSATGPATAQEGIQAVEVAATGSCETSGTGGISGQVTVPGGTPHQGGLLTLYAADGRAITSVYSNGSGVYQFSGLKTGSYILKAVPSGASVAYALEWFNNQTSPLAANPIGVFSGVTTTVNIQFPFGAYISGQVTASDGGPLQSVFVSVYDSRGDRVASDYTDASGFYGAAPGLHPGQYRVSFGEPSGRPYLPEYYNDQPDLASATPITITIPTGTIIVNATLARGAQITGRVTHAVTGLPVPAYMFVYGEGGSDFELPDANGYYTTTTGLRTGEYTVSFSQASEAQNLYGSSQVVSVTAPNTLTGVNGTLSPAGRITGRVTDAGGAPLSSADVYVSNDDGSYQDYFYTNVSGVYTATALPSGSYSLHFRKNGYLSEYYNDKSDRELGDLVTVVAPNTVTGIDAALAAGGTITGVVTAADTGLPLRDADVYVYDATGRNVVNTTLTSNGQYTVASLPSGQYRLRFVPRSNGRACGYQAEWFSDKATLETADPISVTAGAVTPNINAALARGSALMGQVVDAVTAAPLKDIEVTVYNSAGQRVARGRTTFLGYYITAPALPSGAYRLLFEDDDLGYVDEYYNDKPSLSTADSVTVNAPNDVTGVSAALAKGGLIAGRVTASDTGTGLPYVDVIVYDAGGQEVGYSFTDSDGRYTVLDGIPTGDYRVGFVYYSGGDLLSALATPLAPEPDAQPQGADDASGEGVLTLDPALESARVRPQSVGIAQIGFGTSYLSQFYNNKRTLAEADPVSVTAPNTTSEINAVLLRGIFLPLITR